MSDIVRYSSNGMAGRPFRTNQRLIRSGWVSVYGADRYTACPTLRFLNGTFFLFYLEHLTPRWRFETHLALSRDLMDWEPVPRNPVLDPEGPEDINASDLDLAEFESDGRPKVRVYYGTGNQRGEGGITWAEYDGTLKQFLGCYDA